MIIFGSLIVVIIVTLIFYILNPQKYKWWEFFIPLLSTLIVIIITKSIINYTSVSFTEYWGSYINYVVEEEPWNEWIHKTCEHCTTDSDGNETCYTYDCSYQENHGPEWIGETNLGETISITEKQHDKLVKQFNTKQQIIKTRRNHASRDKAVNSRGTKFEGTRVGKTSNILKTEWNKRDETRQAVSSKHKYENRIKASDLSLFNITIITDEEADSLGLYKYPIIEDKLNYPTILGNIDQTIQEKFQKLNGKFGTSKQLRLWILLFDNKPSIYGQYQENYWVKGNKNELVICIGTKGNEITWSHSFSWSLSSTFTAEVKSKVLELYTYSIISKDNKQTQIAIPITKDIQNILSSYTSLDTSLIKKLEDIKVLPILNNKENITEIKKSSTPILNNQTWNIYYDYLNKNLNRFERREFKEFSYLKVELSKGSIIFIYIFALLISVGLNLWATFNEIEEL
jgi:hypothetical protein